jgi:hypothetical protein
MTTQTLSHIAFGQTQTIAMLRIIVPAGQTIRLPETIQRFEVISGAAWVTMSEDDIVLQPGETLTVENRPYPVLLSAESKKSLMIECWQRQ